MPDVKNDTIVLEQPASSQQVLTKIMVFPSGATAITLPLPPEGFNALHADAATLEKHGLPRRPADPASMRKWEEVMGRTTRFIEPTFVAKTNKRHGPRHRKITDPTETSNNWSGAVVFAPAGSSFASVAGQWNVPSNETRPLASTLAIAKIVRHQGAVTGPGNCFARRRRP